MPTIIWLTASVFLLYISSKVAWTKYKFAKSMICLPELVKYEHSLSFAIPVRAFSNHLSILDYISKYTQDRRWNANKPSAAVDP